LPKERLEINLEKFSGGIMKNVTMFIVLAILGVLNCSIINGISTSANTISTSSTSLDSMSKSLGSISTSLKSISSSLGSISDSSKDDGKKESRYRDDVKSLTYFYAKNYQSIEFEEDMQTLSWKHGILDWKKNPSSFVGIGAGLKKAGVNQSELNAILSENDTKDFAKLVRKGYTL
jgi:hypothetical protein